MVNRKTMQLVIDRVQLREKQFENGFLWLILCGQKMSMFCHSISLENWKVLCFVTGEKINY